jgi:two-component system nitrogen regulation response regulator GlnG
VLEQAMLQATGPVLLPDFLPPLPPSVAEAEARPGEEGGLADFLDARIRAGSENLYAEALGRMERALLTHVLRHTGGNQLRAARLLGITRGSLRTKVRDLGIRIDRTVSGGEDEQG